MRCLSVTLACVHLIEHPGRDGAPAVAGWEISFFCARVRFGVRGGSCHVSCAQSTKYKFQVQNPGPSEPVSFSEECGLLAGKRGDVFFSQVLQDGANPFRGVQPAALWSTCGSGWL